MSLDALNGKSPLTLQFNYTDGDSDYVHIVDGSKITHKFGGNKYEKSYITAGMGSKTSIANTTIREISVMIVTNTQNEEILLRLTGGSNTSKTLSSAVLAYRNSNSETRSTDSASKEDGKYIITNAILSNSTDSVFDYSSSAGVELTIQGDFEDTGAGTIIKY